MALKPNGNLCKIREQIVKDEVTGITIQFEARDDGTTKLVLFGKFPFGNREIIFDKNGEEGAAGIAITGSCRPSWLHEV